VSDSTADHLKVIPGFTRFYLVLDDRIGGAGYHTGSSVSGAVASYTRSSNFRTEIAISLWSPEYFRGYRGTSLKHMPSTPL
jgi:hypothetical protein